MHDTFLLSLSRSSTGRRRTVAVTEGQSLTLGVHLEGKRWSAFQWQVGKRGGGFADIMDGATTPGYEILQAPRSSDGAIFRCVAFECEHVRHSQELRLRVLSAVNPLRRVHTVEELIAAKHSIKDFHQIEFFELWNLLPASTRRALLRGMEDAARLAGKPTLLSAVEDLLSPALGRPLNPLLGDYRAEDLGGIPVMPFLLGSVGFLRTPAALAQRLDAAIPAAQTCGRRFSEAATPGALRRLMALAIGDAEGLENIWALLDTAEWAPQTLARVSDAA
ncbi:MAG: hypothetical protein ABIZ80_13160, partial [Bryobacteraceae bacterium]